jgi:DNA-binding SARP family transcriptional activator
MPSLTLSLLGPPSVTRADGSVVSFRLRKELALLAYLALDSGALDVATFQELLAASSAHRHQPRLPCAACAARLQQAVGLYRGEFLSGFELSDAATFEEWALIRRQALHQQALDALTTLADYQEQVGDYVALCGYARRQLELEPWHEPAQRQLMRGPALAGDRDAALTQYERCRQVLADELGIELDVETRALYERIRA